MLLKLITYFGQPCVVACDAKCVKAWGINNRPKHQHSDDSDDYTFFTDEELPDPAPRDPGTYEGGHAKPRTPEERLNKWCVRECERSELVEPGNLAEIFPYYPEPNMPHRRGADTREGMTIQSEGEKSDG